MRAFRFILVFTFATLMIPNEAWPADKAKVPLHILYLSREQDESRSAAFTKFLSAKFFKCVTAKRDDFESSLLDEVDVVLLDWSQQERPRSGQL